MPLQPTMDVMIITEDGTTTEEVTITEDMMLEDVINKKIHCIKKPSEKVVFLFALVKGESSKVINNY